MLLLIALCAIAFITSLLTFFSGFGLGTILLPVFALHYPLPLAIAMTAVVHLLNNLFKAALIARHTNVRVAIRFGVPAALAALVGAELLARIGKRPPLTEYSLLGFQATLEPLKMIIAILLVVFTLFEVLPALKHLTFSERYIPLGGLLSGFFGGLSGHQGALRSAFLSRAKLSKEAFIATGVVIACAVDISRMCIYVPDLPDLTGHAASLAPIVFSAFAGAWVGNRFLKKLTLSGLQKLIASMLLIFALALGVGLI